MELGNHKESALEFAEKMSVLGFNLDFTLKSLEKEIDKILKSKKVNLSDSSEEGWKNQAGLEAYIGETLSRLFDGIQKGEFYSENPAVNFYSCYIEFGSYRHYPSHFLGYRIHNGPKEGSYKKYLKKLLPEINERKDKS